MCRYNFSFVPAIHRFSVQFFIILKHYIYLSTTQINPKPERRERFHFFIIKIDQKRWGKQDTHLLNERKRGRYKHIDRQQNNKCKT